MLQIANEHKKILYIGGGVIFLILLLFLLFFKKQIATASAVIQQAQERVSATDYTAEYSEQFSRTIGSVPESYNYRIVETKSGTNYKKEIYVDEIALLEKYIRTADASFYCVGGPKLMCVRREQEGALFPDLGVWEERGFLRASVSKLGAIIDGSSLKISCAEYSLIPEAFTDKNISVLFQALGGELPVLNGIGAVLRGSIQQYEIGACFDDSTGILVERVIKIRQMIPAENGASVEYESENIYVLKSLSLDPLIIPDDFQIAE